LLSRKDRGRPIDPTAWPKAFGETTIASDVPGADLLDEDLSQEGGGSEVFYSDDEEVLPSTNETQKSLNVLSNKLDASDFHKGEEEVSAEQDDTDEVYEDYNDDNMNGIEDGSDMNGDTEKDDDEELDSEKEGSDQVPVSNEEDMSKDSSLKGRKRKLIAYIGQPDAADASLGALKRLAEGKKAETSTDKIFSDEDFKRIRVLKICM
jgi:protein SDA1